MSAGGGTATQTEAVDAKAALDELVRLSHEVGRPERDLVLQAEGNTSSLLDDGTFLVKASGVRLARAESTDFVRLRLAPLLDAVQSTRSREASELFAAARVEPVRNGCVPSIETFVHVICLGVASASVVVHTHPTPVVGLLCTPTAENIVTTGALFPEEVVVCGGAPLYVAYAEPGLPLARAVFQKLRAYMEHHHEPPRAIYLENHGLFALGSSAAEALVITEMAVKAARVRLTALAAGGLRPLAPSSIVDLMTRPDEFTRQAQLRGGAL